MITRIPYCLFILLALGLSARAELVTEPITYDAAGKTLQGVIVYDDEVEGPRPGVLVVHEWWGHNEYARKRASMLAELGYTAFAVDMYGEGKQADHPDNAREFATEVMSSLPLMVARFTAAMYHLQNHPTVDREKIAAIGYCFGGAVVLNMARKGVDLDAVVSFHGSLATPEPAVEGMVKARILVCHGADDSFISAEDVAGFKQEMKDAKADYTFAAYPGAKHSFTNPEADAFAAEFGMDVAYSAEADRQSWDDMKSFLAESFE